MLMSGLPAERTGGTGAHHTAHPVNAHDSGAQLLRTAQTICFHAVTKAPKSHHTVHMASSSATYLQHRIILTIKA
jgi:hypothetical protein